MTTGGGQSAAGAAAGRWWPPPPRGSRETFARGASELAVSHDGRKVAVVVRGQVFAGPAVSGGSSGARAAWSG